MKTKVVNTTKKKPAAKKTAKKAVSKAPVLTPPTEPARALNAKADVRDLDTDFVVVSALNPRQPTAAEVQELARSIHSLGQSSAALARPLPGKKGYFELAAGARRRAACAFLGIKLRTEIRDMSDDEFLDVILADNLQREDPDPLKEAALVGKRLAEGTSQSEIAARYGKTVSWVHRRAKLSNLSPSTIKEWQTGGIQRFTIEMLEIVAAWSHADQRSHLGNWSLHNCSNLRDLREYLKNTSCNLKGADFLKLAHTAVPGCGAAGCAQSSQANPHLFGEIEGFKSACGRCLNTECFNKRKNLHQQHQLNEVTKGYSITAIIKHDWNEDWPSYSEKTTLNGKTFTGSSTRRDVADKFNIHETEPKKGESKAALYVQDGVLSIVWLTPKPLRKGQTPSSNGSVIPDPLTREDKLTRKRWALVRPELVKAIKQLATPPFTIESWAKLISVFGISRGESTRHPNQWQTLTEVTADAKPLAEVLDSLWQDLNPILRRRLEFVDGLKSFADDDLPREMRSIAALLGIDLAAMKNAADLQIPPPKSWGPNIDVHTLKSTKA